MSGLEYGILKDVAVLQILAIGPKVTAGTGLFVITISSVDAEHGLLLTVHRSVAEVPDARFVIFVIRDDGVTIVALPETRDHIPVPGDGASAAIIKFPLLHCDISGPALATLGGAAMVREKLLVD